MTFRTFFLINILFFLFMLIIIPTFEAIFINKYTNKKKHLHL
jgi:hypothetical protein